MGSCSSRSTDVAGGPGEHTQHAPMWVLRVERVLQMTGRLKPHQTLKAQALLEIWMPKMLTMFVSHQWLGVHHPDPRGEKLKVLQSLLKNLITKRVTIEHDVISQFFGKQSARLHRIQEWFIWLDYFCVPQLLGGDTEDQWLYVKSIPFYVEACHVLVALVPPAVHYDTKAACDIESWLQRGWCRLELWCNQFSARSQFPIVEVKNPQTVRFANPQWYRYPVHSGEFALEADRFACSSVIRVAMAKYVADLRQSNQTSYRLYLSLLEEMTGLDRKLRSFEEFVSDFDFQRPLQQYNGLGPVACAALSGDEALLRRVVAAKASLHTHAPGMVETFNAPDATPLHLTLCFQSQNLHILETLLELRANPNSSTINVPPPLGWCRTVEAVDLLVRNGAGVNDQGKQAAAYCPIHCMSGLGAPAEVTARLLELRADVHGGRGGLASASPLHCLAFSGDSRNDLRTAQLLVDSRADLNQLVKPEGFFKMLQVMCVVYSQCRGETGNLVRCMTHMSTTPLGWCALQDNHGLLVFLLHARADPERRNTMSLRPIDIARSEMIRAILQDPTQHFYHLEHGSDLITETL